MNHPVTTLPGTPASSWSVKFIECLFVSVAIWNFYNSMVLFPLTIMMPGVSGPIFIFRIINLPLIVLGLAFAIFYPLQWQRKESKGAIDSSIRHAWLRGIIRYWLALEICNYGFAKILGTQFAHMYFRDYTLVKDLSGVDLTWYYFGHSHPFSVIIALLQVGGAIMLLFRRTVLTGAMILFPIMANIVLIDIFYDLYRDALMNALLFTAGLLYLLLLFRKELQVLFLKSLLFFPRTPLGPVKNLLRLLAVAYAFAFIYYFTTTRAPAALVGKWDVDLLIRNGDTTKANDWLTNASAWKSIYLESFPKATLNPNPYIIETARAQQGSYKYDDKLNKIAIITWRLDNKSDTLNFSVQKTDNTHMQWTSLSPNNNVLVRLSKVD